MSYDIYAGLKDKDGVWGPVVSFEAAEFEKFDEKEESFKPNPKFIPGVAFNMSGGNWVEMVMTFIATPQETVADVEMLSLGELRSRAVKALARAQDEYIINRLIQLVNTCDLGVTRGAERLIVT